LQKFVEEFDVLFSCYLWCGVIYSVVSGTIRLMTVSHMSCHYRLADWRHCHTASSCHFQINNNWCRLSRPFFVENFVQKLLQNTLIDDLVSCHSKKCCEMFILKCLVLMMASLSPS